MGLAAIPLGVVVAGTIVSGTAFLGLGFVVGVYGVADCLDCVWAGAPIMLNAVLHTPGPLGVSGQIVLTLSAGARSVSSGWFGGLPDESYGIAGKLAVVGFRLVACTGVATALVLDWSD